MSRNHLGWQDPLSGLVAGPDQTEVKDELERSFCRTRRRSPSSSPRVTFRGDNRADLAGSRRPRWCSSREATPSPR